MKKLLSYAALTLILAGCASSGPIATGKDTYMLTKTSAGGVFVSGATIKADLLKEANEFCDQKGGALALLSSDAKNAIPFARMPSSEIHFECAKK
ncbi:hypothetical protein KW842_25585 [Duganella sp. sic0402]|uniref:hypothetical protein n=1 Tax=Duganella sp. sic0402 TaxID=2854786 RepID=UPI001C45259A|nr:hypothetical protein [Duganella sp. sic0402]MBV7539146.1 hypothetical protein [Duganella sp. sic0402]